jgi:uncharacterized lipoprotein YmbA
MKLTQWISRRTSFAAILVMVSLAGCSSLPAPRYYALDAVTPASPAHPGVAPLIHVRRISVPAEMDHRGLTHHLGPTQLAVSDSDQWSAPLTDLIQGTLSRDLGERLGFEHIVAAQVGGAQAGASQAFLDLDFVALSADDACGVDAQVNWTLSVPNGTARHGTAHLMAPATGCPTGLPAALSAVLGELADQLAQQLSAP